ncbi:MAG: diguanylate cyclase (GGDEF)-like protein [Acidimicrobiales bacterium]|jgi:diguanylate cyclase (GGDEF)-like protein
MIRSETGAALVLLDVDAFRAINDSLGHETGDELLRLVASRLRGVLNPDAVLVRLGSDEFAAISCTARNEREVLEFTETLRSVFVEPFRVAGRTEQLSVSTGVAVADRPDEVKSLHRQAEIALLAAKRANNDGPVFYEASFEETIARSTRIRRALYSAVYDDEFEVVYQPIVSAESSAIHSLEALLRWNSPTLGRVGPDEFIPIAEHAGDIDAIGQWVIETVCRQLSVWTAMGISPDLSVSFNVSARQLADEDFATSVSTTARVWGIDPQRLTVEVTETAALDEHGTAVDRLNELRAAGFQISIDDSGSGYSNLGQLLRVPFDILKIDRSLLLMLTDMRSSAGGDSTDPCQILQAVVSIAEILGAPVVCEGVETDEQRESLIASGITYIQGYLTGRPASAADTARLLELPLAATTLASAVAPGRGIEKAHL